MGVPPTIPNFDKLMSEGQEYLVETAIQEVKDQGYPCDSACEAAIKAGYGEIAKVGSGQGSGSAAAAPARRSSIPHPLAVEQPAIMKVQVTRRTETAGIPVERYGRLQPDRVEQRHQLPLRRRSSRELPSLVLAWIFRRWNRANP